MTDEGVGVSPQLMSRETKKKESNPILNFLLFYRGLNDITRKTGNGMFVAINSLLSEIIFSSSVRVVSRTTLIRPELAQNVNSILKL